MGSRLKLQILLESLPGVWNVYFKAPEATKMVYPCIVYQLSLIKTKFADNNPYFLKKRYQITVIDKDPDSSIPDLISQLPMSAFDRHFRTAGLNHFVYNIYF